MTLEQCHLLTDAQLRKLLRAYYREISPGTVSPCTLYVRSQGDREISIIGYGNDKDDQYEIVVNLDTELPYRWAEEFHAVVSSEFKVTSVPKAYRIAKDWRFVIRVPVIGGGSFRREINCSILALIHLLETSGLGRRQKKRKR